MSPTVFQPCLSRDLAVLSGSLRYSKSKPPFEVDLPGLVRRQLVAVLVEDVQRAHHRLADRAGVCQPVLCGDQRRADRLGGGVVLVDDRPPPVHHLLLDLDRARRRGMHHAIEAGDVVRIAHGFRQFQHPDEHRRDELAMGDAVALDRVEAALGVELLHHHGRDAHRLNAHRPHRRGGVVQRGRADIDGLGVQPEVDQSRHEAGHLGRREVRKLALMPFGRPVVPDEYWRRSPSISSSIGVSG